MDSSAIAALARKIAVSEDVSPRDAYVTITRLLRMGFTLTPPTDAI